MAQHDMNIANQGFPATRADLNNALQALASNNSGTSAPSTTFANQWWYDTTNNKLYIRNEANNAWIQVAVLDQTNNEWQITTGVIQAKDSDGLALKTDDGTTRLFINDSDGAVSMGTTTMTVADNSNTLTLVSTDVDGSVGPVLNLSRDNSSATGSDSIGRIVFNADDSANNQTEYASIQGTILDASNTTEDGMLTFDTATAGNPSIEKLRLGSTEASFNEDSADVDFRIESNANANMFHLDGNENRVNIGSTTGISSQFTVQNENKAYTTLQKSNNSITGGTADANYASISRVYNTVSAGSKLIIPVTSQGSLWHQHYIEIIVVTGEYNMSSAARGGRAEFSFVSLTALQQLAQHTVTGNISSVSISGMNIEINFSGSYTSGLSNYEGILLHGKVLSRNPELILWGSAAMN